MRELSVNPRSVPLVKRVMRCVSAADARKAAELALAAGTAEESEAILAAALRSALGDSARLAV